MIRSRFFNIVVFICSLLSFVQAQTDPLQGYSDHKSKLAAANTHQYNSYSGIGAEFINGLLEKSKNSPDRSFTDALKIAYGQTGWGIINPLPTPQTLQSSYFVNDQTGWLVGAFGTILNTTDGGISWSPQLSHTQETLLSVFFVSSSTGWIVGNKGTILATTNAGRAWVSQVSNTTNSLTAVFFISASRGYTVGAYGALLTTSDGGATWITGTAFSATTMTSIYFSSSLIGWATGVPQKIYKTTDGGTTWFTQVNPSASNLSAVYCLNDSTAWAVGEAGTIIKTTNSGRSWAMQTSGSTALLTSVCFPSANTGYASGYSISAISGNDVGDILKTTNGGTSWSSIGGTGRGLNTVFFSSTSTGYSAGSSGLILKSTNAGANWVSLQNGCNQPLKAVSFPSAKIGFITGSSGTFVQTTNGGGSFTNTSLGSTDLSSVSFISDSSGWITQRSGTVFKTTNSGSTWVPETTGVSAVNNAVTFTSPLNGWIAANSGLIYRTTNGGALWSVKELPLTNNLNSIFFSSSTTGWVVGNGGVIYRTTDGGVNWAQQTSGVITNLNSVYFVNSLKGWAAGANAVILSTTNGGASWQQQSNVFYPNGKLNGIYALSASVAYAVGDYGIVLMTSDSGSTWSPMLSPTSASLKGITGVLSGSSAVLYAIGDGGVIIVSAVSPLRPQRWLWTGGIDSSWNNPNNWTPIGVPLPGDSVLIGAADHYPTITASISSVTIGALTIETGGKLKLYSSPKIQILGDVIINGSLIVDTLAQPGIYVGGNWTVAPDSASDKGFVIGLSTVFFKGNGTLNNNFYNAKIDSLSQMTASGNINIWNCMVNFYGLLRLQPNDTINVLNSSPQALFNVGNVFVRQTLNHTDAAGKNRLAAANNSGFIKSGTITRAIDQTSTDAYQFSSQYTYVKFNSGSQYPSTVSLTDYPDTSFETFGNGWTYVTGTVDTINHVINVPHVNSFDVWGIGPPATDKKSKVKKPIKHVYTAGSGSNKYSNPDKPAFDFQLSLQYDPTEIPEGVNESSLQLLVLTRTPITVTLLPEAYAADAATNPQLPNQSFEIHVASSSSPYSDVVSTQNIKISASTLSGTANFIGLPSGTYYLYVKSSNTLETWSKIGGESITAGDPFSYDFTSDQSQAYGNNLVQVAKKWCLISGDVNQDGLIDVNDLLLIDNAVNNYITGNVVTDLDGSGCVDYSDLRYYDNNSYQSRRKITPASTLTPESTPNKTLKKPEVRKEKAKQGS